MNASLVSRGGAAGAEVRQQAAESGDPPPSTSRVVDRPAAHRTATHLSVRPDAEPDRVHVHAAAIASSMYAR